MKGVVKLQVPAVPMKPKLFFMTLKHNDRQYRFSKVAYSLDQAIVKCCTMSYTFTVNDYVVHQELSVDDINSLFKNFNG